MIFTTFGSDTPAGENNLIRLYYGPFLSVGLVNENSAREFVTLTSPFASETGQILGFIMAGDLNGDLQKDLIVGARDQKNKLSQTLVYFQNSPYGFTNGAGASLTLDGVTPLLAGDINGDSLCDLVFLDASGKSVSIWFQRKGAPLTSEWKSASIPVALPKAAMAAAMGDINGDGRQEIFITLTGGGIAVIRLGEKQ